MKASGLVKKIGLAILGLGLTVANPQKTNSLDFNLFAGGSLDFGVTSPNIKINTLPKSFRTVPIHPDDGSGEIEIEDEELKFSPGWYGHLKLNAGVEVDEGKFNLRVGPFVQGLADDNLMSNLCEENYFGSGHERGAALVYYCANIARVNFGADAQLSFNLHKEEIFYYPQIEMSSLPRDANIFMVHSPTFIGTQKTDLFVEYSPTLVNLSIENGWDRFGDLESNENYIAAYIINHAFKIGINHHMSTDNREGHGKVFMGVAIPQMIRSYLDKSSIELFPQFFLGMEVGMGYTTKK